MTDCIDRLAIEVGITSRSWRARVGKNSKVPHSTSHQFIHHLISKTTERRGRDV